MNLTVPFGELITGGIDVVSQSLALPVMIVLFILVIVTVVLIGTVISEYTLLKKVPVSVIRDLIYDISNADSLTTLVYVIHNAEIPESQKEVLEEIAHSESLTKLSREALARKLVESEEEKTEKTLQKTDIITRIGPTLGLMGTLIPLGPGLAALGSGDIVTLAESLTVAFDTTIVGIGSGAIAYVISKIRRSWYEHYLSDLDALTDALLDKMEDFDG